jgi:very-short-patch-repair endonuclease
MSEEPKYLDEKGLVICQLCGKSMMTISPPHLYYKHNKMTVADYKKQFPNAPTFNDEFSARSKYGKEKLFKMKEKEKIDTDLVFDDEAPPKIEELMIKEFSIDMPTMDPIQRIKIRILDHLKVMFPNIKQNYLIQKFDGQGKLMYEYISDFADPVSKINVEFPKTFWHNKGSFDNLRNYKLEQDGWIIYEIMTLSASNEEIDKIIKRIN